MTRTKRRVTNSGKVVYKSRGGSPRGQRMTEDNEGFTVIDPAFDDMDGTEEELINQLTRGHGSDD